MNADWQINSLYFDDSGITGASQSFRVFSSNDKTLTIGSGGISNFSEAVQTIDVDLALAANQFWWAKGQDLVINGDRSGSSRLSIVGDTPFRSVTITGNGSAFTGPIHVFSGTLRLGAGDTVNDASEIEVETGATFDLGGTEEEIGLLSGSGDVLLGTGRLILGSNTRETDFDGRLLGTGTLTYASTQESTLRGNGVLFRGLLEVLAGRLIIGGIVDTLGSDTSVEVAAGAALTITGNGETFGSLAGGGTLALNAPTTVGVNNRSTVFSGNLINGASFTKTGRGTLTLTGTNTFTGLLTVAGGTLQLGLGNTLLDSHAVQVDAAGRLAIDGDNETIGVLTGAGEIDLKRSLVVTASAPASSFSGRILGQGGLTKGGSNTFTLSGINEFQGPLTVLNGTLEIAGNANTLSNTHVVDLATTAARLSIAGDGEDFGGLRGVGRVLLAADMGTGFNDRDSDFAGQILGTGRVTKGGHGTLTLRGSNQVNGALTARDGRLSIAAGRTAFSSAQVQRGGSLDIVGGSFVTTGTLDVDGSLALRAGVLDVTTLALDPRGSFTFAGGTLRATTIEGSFVNGGTLAPGHSPGRTTVIGNYTQIATGRLEIELAGPNAFDVLDVRGVAALNGTLAIRLLDGFVPEVGAAFEFLTAADGIQGSFSVVLFPQLVGRLLLLDRSQLDRLSLRVVSTAGLEPVPLPPSAWLFGGALLALAARHRRRG
ncbi:MAG: autotransporter-associated beta strand repeat-containing protein [Gammaproteobacteria bacterium]|nr:autotransporter-associated beta strand repeat-containing protein [Gammaproteobacteria bacterium]